MAKFFISNNESKFNDVLNSNKAVFKKYCIDCVDGNLLVTFAKINDASRLYKPNHSIWAVGSFIYKRKIGEEALNLIYQDYKDLGVSGLKKEILGYYNIVLSYNNNVVIFNDYYGVYDLCYHAENDYYSVGSQLKDVAYNKNDLIIDEFSFIQETCQLGAFPGKTIFKEINKIRGNEYITIVKNKLIVETIPDDLYAVTYDYQGESKALLDISKMLIEYSSIISDAYGKIVVFLTGGLDSRLNFAAYKKISNLRTQYWRSYGVNREDEIIAQKISSYYNIMFNYTDCFDPEDRNGIDVDYQKLLFDEVGFYNFVCNGNPKIINEIRKYGNNGDFLAFGYFCEAIRLREWAASLKSETFSLDSYIDDYYINKSLSTTNYSKIKEYREYLRINYIEQLNSIGVKGDYDKIPLSVFEKFRWIMSRLCDSRMECLNNNFAYSFAIMSIPAIHQAILALPDYVIRDGVFQVKLIRQLDKSLINNFDVFSHRRAYVINKKGYKKRKITLVNICDEVFSLFPFIKPLLKCLLRKRSNQKTNVQDVYAQVKNLLAFNCCDSFFNVDEYRKNGNDSRIKRLRQVLIGISLLKGLNIKSNLDIKKE